MNFLAEEGYRPITISQLVEHLKRGTLPQKGVAVTVDDGHHYDTVWPVMRRLNFPFTVYIYTSAIGRPKHLSQEQLKEMVAAGVEVGSHTKTHAHLIPPKKPSSWRTLSHRQRVEEVTGSKKLIESWLGIVVKSLAYPYGLYDAETEKLAVASGYEAMVTLDWGNNSLGTSPFRLKRKQVLRDTTLEQFKKLLR